MKLTRKNLSLLLGCVTCSALLAFSGASQAKADTSAIPLSEPIMIYGTVHKENGRLSMTDIKGDTTLDELILNVSEETRILDAVDGLPLSIDSIQEGEFVYAYISHAMALSLPPQSHAEMIISRIPADFAAPSYATVDTLTQNSDGTAVVKSMRAEQYKIDQTTILLPYLTRNIVTVNDLTKGRTCLIWPNVSMAVPSEQEAGVTGAYKIVIFPGESKVSGPASDPALLGK